MGPTGATGQQRPAGPSGGVGKLSSYTAAGQTVTLGPRQYTQIDATCAAGDIAVSVGFVQGTSADAVTQNNQQLANQYATITITNNYTTPIIVQAVATCLHVG